MGWGIEGSKGSRNLFRGKYLYSRKVSPIACVVTCENGIIAHCRMCSDVKVRQRAIPRASVPPVRQVALASEKAGFPRKRLALIYISGQGGI